MIERINILYFLVFLFCVEGIVVDTFANPNKRKKNQTESCLECHSSLKLGRLVHAAVEDDCANCHKPTGVSHPDGDGNGFGLIYSLPSLCFQCHSDKIMKKNLHTPFAEGSCLDCHQVHSSNNEKLLNEPSVSDICLQCHEVSLPQGSIMHAPVELGECASCHDAHQSDFEYFLKDSKAKICTECHDGIKAQIESKHPHAAAVDDCSNCHNSHGGKPIFLTEEVPALCLNCHEMSGKAHQHQPVADGECLTCHSPHGSDNEKILTVESSGELCVMCHDVTANEGELLHAAVEMGECVQCHDPHQSENYALIKHNNPRYCVNCHSDLVLVDKMSTQHPPYQEECATCHAAHKSTQPKLLTDEANNICLMCHDNVQEQMNHKPIVHKVLFEKSSCIQCHSPHASNQSALLNEPEQKLCLDCHSKEIKTDHGIIKNMSSFIANKEIVHAPVNEGCVLCHDAHAEERPFLLNSLFPPVKYVPANTKNFELCFNCHNEELMTLKYTTDATGFRSGDLNLHYEHLKGNKARNCNLCHDVHASDNEHLIKDFTWFGQWKMPFEYEYKVNGGSCNTGCHEKRSYRNLKGVD